MQELCDGGKPAHPPMLDQKRWSGVGEGKGGLSTTGYCSVLYLSTVLPGLPMEDMVTLEVLQPPLCCRAGSGAHNSAQQHTCISRGWAGRF